MVLLRKGAAGTSGGMWETLAGGSEGHVWLWGAVEFVGEGRACVLGPECNVVGVLADAVGVLAARARHTG